MYKPINKTMYKPINKPAEQKLLTFRTLTHIADIYIYIMIYLCRK